MSRLIIKETENITFDFNLLLLARTQRSKKREVDLGQNEEKFFTLEFIDEKIGKFNQLHLTGLRGA